MIPTLLSDQAPVPPPAYTRVQAQRGPALHIDALTLVISLHLLALCRLAVQLVHWRCPPPLPAGPGGQIGRASCRERVSISVVALSGKKYKLRSVRSWPDAERVLRSV